MGGPLSDLLFDYIFLFVLAIQIIISFGLLILAVMFFYKRIKVVRLTKKAECMEQRKDKTDYLKIYEKIEKTIQKQKYIEQIDILENIRANLRMKLYLNTRMGKYVKVCPECGSTDSAVESYGYIVRDFCKKCGYSSIKKSNILVGSLIYFPEIRFGTEEDIKNLEDSIIYCPYCNKKIKDSWDICLRCEKDLEDNNELGIPSAKEKIISYIFILLLLIALLLLLLYWK